MSSSASRLSQLRNQTESNLRAAISASKDTFNFAPSPGYSMAPTSEPASTQSLLSQSAPRSDGPPGPPPSSSLLNSYEMRSSPYSRTGSPYTAAPQPASATAALYGA